MMKVTDFTKHALRVRRERKSMAADGWEEVSENGGKLWELHRGGRWNHVITDVKIAADGKSLWIKTQDTRKLVQSSPIPITHGERE